MDETTFESVRMAIIEARRRFPNCRVAGCECDEWNHEWRPGCFCAGHWRELDRAFAGEPWILADAEASAEAGAPACRLPSVTPPA